MPRSKLPQNRKARKIVRQYLLLSLVASDPREDEAIRAKAAKRLEALDKQLDAALGQPIYAGRTEDAPAAAPAPAAKKARRSRKAEG